jgi:hypothetical protein
VTNSFAQPNGLFHRKKKKTGSPEDNHS